MLTRCGSSLRETLLFSQLWNLFVIVKYRSVRRSRFVDQSVEQTLPLLCAILQGLELQYKGEF
jgi:hypothetical protein